MFKTRKIKDVTSKKFAQFGHVISGYDFEPLSAALGDIPLPKNGVSYVAEETALQSLALKDTLAWGVYGGLPIQVGYCFGWNRLLNCLEFHTGSEVIYAVDDIVLMVAHAWHISGEGIIDTSRVRAFFVPKGTAVLLYGTSGHYAPCSAREGEPFRTAIILLRGTNAALPEDYVAVPGCSHLTAVDKKLYPHPDSPEATEQGAVVGLTGPNLKAIGAPGEDDFYVVPV